MQNDPVRERIRDLLWQRGLNMREASLAIGRNVSYMHGFLERGTPKVLSYQDAEKLAALLECEAGGPAPCRAPAPSQTVRGGTEPLRVRGFARAADSRSGSRGRGISEPGRAG